MNTKRIPPATRFWSKVDQAGPGGCWFRLEAIVLATAGTSVKVRFERRRYDGSLDEAWIDGALVLAILPAPP